jgi:hypothetical protein
MKTDQSRNIEVIFMGTEALLVVLGFILITGLFAVTRDRQWHTLATAKGRKTIDLEWKNSFLQSNNIQCRIKAAANGRAIRFAASRGGSTADHASGTLYKLEVLPQDKKRAEDLLFSFEQKRQFHRQLNV